MKRNFVLKQSLVVIFLVSAFLTLGCEDSGVNGSNRGSVRPPQDLLNLIAGNDYTLITRQFIEECFGRAVVDVLIDCDDASYTILSFENDHYNCFAVWSDSGKNLVSILYFTGGKRRSQVRQYVFDQEAYYKLLACSEFVRVFG